MSILKNTWIKTAAFAALYCLLSVNIVFADIPAGYYNGIENKKDESLRETLSDIIDGHSSIAYGSGMHSYYASTDCDKDGYIMDMYSKCKFKISDAGSSQQKVCDCWNKEHTVPSSWFKKAKPAYSDFFHIYPTDARINNFRGNMPYGETDNTDYVTKDANKEKGLGHIGTSSFSGYSGKVYEPDDEYKGDLARNYMYMIARYMTMNFTQADEGEAVFTYSGGKAYFTSYAIDLFMKWHREDPVSQKEIDRNNAVYESVQHNRNPFIDYPYLAEYLWGKEKGKGVDMAHLISSSDTRFIPGVSNGYSDATDDIQTYEDAAQKAKKVLYKDQIVVIVNGQKYSLMGERID
ncbi:MAG: endonuclease [Paludibacteraceae bacterium]|nr:endonuclease [Paludibacteraceae bacterium]